MNDLVTGTSEEKAPLPELSALQDKILLLKEKLSTATPGFETLLRDVHTTLKKNEALSHMLTDEGVGIIIAGLTKLKNTVLVPEKVKAITKKRANLLSADDV